MSLFRRMFTIGKSEAHAALDKLEDPIKMAEQGIRDLRGDLNDSFQGLAKVKAQAIRAKHEFRKQREIAADYEQKAMMLLQRVQAGQLDPAEGDRLAAEALRRRDQAIQRATEVNQEVDRFDQMTRQLETNVHKLKTQIEKWENELHTLKARAQVGRATRKLNEQLARVDSNGTISMLERMRDRVREEESLAQAYGEIAQVEVGIDGEIESALGGATRPSETAALEALKAKMGLRTLPSP
jgi:phage shock protein A